jgi:hypothetical protein
MPRDAHDEWKDEYESNLARWKHENALQKEKAARVRKEWEDKQALGSIGGGSGEEVVVPPLVENDEFLGAHLARAQNTRLEGGWEKVEDGRAPTLQTSPHPADGRDGERQGRHEHDNSFLQVRIRHIPKLLSQILFIFFGGAERFAWRKSISVKSYCPSQQRSSRRRAPRAFSTRSHLVQLSRVQVGLYAQQPDIVASLSLLPRFLKIIHRATSPSRPHCATPLARLASASKSTCLTFRIRYFSVDKNSRDSSAWFAHH